MEIIWQPEAVAALERVTERLEEFHAGAGVRAARRIRERVSQLAFFPYSGRMVPEVSLHNLRETVIPPYRILYIVIQGRIEVVTLFHGALAFDPDD